MAHTTMSIIKSRIYLPTVIQDFKELGLYSAIHEVAGVSYQVIIIQDASLLYTVAITPRHKSVEILEHTNTLEAAVATANRLLDNIALFGLSGRIKAGVETM